MSMIFGAINTTQLITAIKETIFMSFISLFFAVIFGTILGIILYVTQKDGLLENLYIYKVLDLLVNVFRAVPFIILLILVIPLTKALVGTMLGAKAALPSLIISATPFYARVALIAFNEIDKGTIEALEAMGASKLQIITKVLIPEAKPALISGIALTGISLVGYTAMAGAIGAGGLGDLAYKYGFARNNKAVLYTATAIVVIIVFVIQGIGDYITKKVDKR